MSRFKRWTSVAVVAATSFLLVAAESRAQLVPPGDFRGKSLDQWGLDYTAWAVAIGLGGQTLPDTFDGVRFLPPDFEDAGPTFSASVTIEQGTPLVLLPVFAFGEMYAGGGFDDISNPLFDQVLPDVTIQTTLNGVVVLEGVASTFPERPFGRTAFPAPIPYAAPVDRGPGPDAVSAIWGLGVTTIFDGLPVGVHTLTNTYNSPNFFGSNSLTYTITVVPEPSALCGLAMAGVGATLTRRRVVGARR